MSGTTKILFVCLANVCRSPIAETVFLDVIKKNGLYTKFAVDSAGLVSTSGKSVSGKTLYVLKSHKLNYSKKSRQINNEDFSNFDFILTMDQKNIADLIQMAPPNSRAKIMLLGEFDPQGEKTIQDPYFDKSTTGFEKCYQQCVRCCSNFVQIHK